MDQVSGITFGNQIISKDVFEAAFTEALKNNNYRVSFLTDLNNIMDWCQLLEMGGSWTPSDLTQITSTIIRGWNAIREKYLFTNPTVTLMFAIDNQQSITTQYLVPEGIFFTKNKAGLVDKTGQELLQYLLIKQADVIFNDHWNGLIKSMQDNLPTNKEIDSVIDHYDIDSKRRERLEKLKKYPPTKGKRFTYYEDFFTPIHRGGVMNVSGNKMGQLFETFLKHNLMRHRNINIATRRNITSVREEEGANFYPMLLSAFSNNRAWQTGGDIIVVGENGITANYQIKFTQGQIVSYNTKASLKRFQTAIKAIQTELNENNNFKQTAAVMYEHFSTQAFCEKAAKATNDNIKDNVMKLVQNELQKNFK